MSFTRKPIKGCARALEGVPKKFCFSFWEFLKFYFGLHSVGGTAAGSALQFTGKGGFLSGSASASNCKNIFLLLFA